MRSTRVTYVTNRLTFRELGVIHVWHY